MKGEDAYLNKQGSTSPMPDSHTKVTIQHLNLKNHAGIPHTQANCGDMMAWRSNDAIYANQGSSHNLKKVSYDFDNLLGTRIICLTL